VNDERSAISTVAPTDATGPDGALSAQDVWRLTLYKWRYSLESHGFSTEQARRLLFLRWLYARTAQPH
jgi:hypothetical protein